MGFEVYFTTEDKEELKKLMGIAIDCGCSKIELYNTPSFDEFPALKVSIESCNKEFLGKLFPQIKE